MQIKKVALEGFRGAKGRTELTIDSGFTIITGKNDAGKSTFLDALNIFLKTRKSRGMTSIFIKEKGPRR